MKGPGEENKEGNELINDNVKFVQGVFYTRALRKQKHTYG